MDYLTNDTELTAVADAIREKCETTDPLEWPDGFIQAIEDCQTGGPELEWLWGNQITNTLSGTIDSTDDAYAAPILNLGVDGVSTQVTTTGKNLLSDATETWANYTIVQGQYRYVEIDVPPSTQLTVSPTSTAAISGISGFNGYVPFWFDTTTFENDHIVYPINANTPRTLTFTSGANGKLYVGLTSTMTQEALDTLWAKVKLQLEAGSTATDYEPYTGGKPSPNPDYPQEILSVDEPTLMVVGKNLFDFTMFDKSSSSYGGCALTRNGDGSWLLSGTNTLEYEWNFNSNAGEQTFSAGTYRLMNVGGSLVGCSLIVTTDIPNHTTVYEGEFTADAPFKVTKWAIRVAVNATIGGTARPAIVSYDATIPLYDGTLRSLPDGTKDELHLTYLRPSTREDWAWYSRELVTRVSVFDLSNVSASDIGITALTNYTQVAYSPYISVGIAGTGNHLCNCLRTSDVGAEGAIWNSSTQPRMFLGLPNSVTTKADALSWITSHNVIVQSPIATPVTTTLDPIELPIMPSENATVWCDGGSAQPTFMLEYIQNANIVISRLEDTIADLATS